jgi:hypothetical protein
MPLTLKEIVQSVARRSGIPVPPGVVGSQILQVAQLFGLMEEFLEDLVTRKAYQFVIREATFTSVADESQGLVQTHAPAGFVRILPETFFNRTTNLPVRLGLEPSTWQAIKAAPGAAGPYYRARFRGNELLFSPTPPAGELFAFEYHSRAFILDEDGITYKTRWEKDTDTCVFPDEVPVAWLRMAWKREKGLEYAEDALRYETHLGALSTRDNNPAPIDMSGGGELRPFGAVVPPGYWNLG